MEANKEKLGYIIVSGFQEKLKNKGINPGQEFEFLIQKVQNKSK